MLLLNDWLEVQHRVVEILKLLLTRWGLTTHQDASIGREVVPNRLLWRDRVVAITSSRVHPNVSVVI